jgi:hypothetical protein
MATQGLDKKRLVDPTVRACDRHGYPWPVASMATGRRKDLNRTRFSTFEHAGQVTDHATGALRKSQLDRQIQLLDNVIETSGNFKDGYLTYSACSDPSVRCRAWMAS